MKLEKSGYTLDIFFQRLIEIVKNFGLGVFFYDVELVLKALKNKMKRDDTLITFRALDLDCVGNVSMQNCVKFYMKYKRDELPLDVVFQIIAKFLLSKRMSAEHYLREANMPDLQQEIDQARFN